MKEFIINDFLVLRLEGNKTNIYVNGKLFDQCKYLLLTIPTDEIAKSKEIESIDEAADILGWTVEGQEGVKYNIDPETEFWGHCSNLQAWYEHNYDTRLLHSNLAFPLLKKLTEVGDPLAKRVFKEEIAKRFESGYPTAIAYILAAKFLDCLNKEEQSLLIKQYLPDILITIENLDELDDEYDYKYDAFLDFFEIAVETRCIEELLPAFFKHINKRYINYQVFYDLFDISEKKGWITEFFPTFLKNIDIISDDCQYYAFYDLLIITQEKGWVEDYFLAFLESIDKFSDLNQYNAFSDLHMVAFENEWLEEYFPAFLESIIKFSGPNQYKAFSDLLRLQDKEWVEENLSVFLESFDKLSGINKLDALSDMSNSLEGSEIMKRYYSQIEARIPTFLEEVNNLSDDKKCWPFIRLLNSIKDPRVLNKYFSQIEPQFLIILENLGKIRHQDKYYTFSTLLRIAGNKGWRQELFPAFLEAVKNSLSGDDKYKALSNLFDSFISPEVSNKCYSQIEALVLAILENLGKIPLEGKFFALSALLKMGKLTGWKEEHLSAFFDIMNAFPDKNKTSLMFYNKVEITEDTSTGFTPAFNELIAAVKSSELWNKFYSQLKTLFYVLLNGIDKIPLFTIWAFESLLRVAQETGWLEESLLVFVEKIYNLSYFQNQAFIAMMNSIKETDLLNKFLFQIETLFIALYNSIDKVRNRDQFEVFRSLYIMAKEMGWIEKHFLVVLESIEKVNSYQNIRMFQYLMNSIKTTDLLKKYYSQIETRLLTLLKEVSGSESYSKLISSVKGIGLIRKHFPTFLKTIDNFQIDERYNAFYNLINPIKDTALLNRYYSQIETHFINLLETIDELWEEEEYDEVGGDFYGNESYNYAVSDLFEIAKEKDWIEELLPAFLKNMEKLPGYIFPDIVEHIKEKGLFEVYLPTFFEAIDEIEKSNRKHIFEVLVKVWQELGLSKKYFLNFANGIAKLGRDRDYSFFCTLVEITEQMDLMKEFFPVLSKAIDAINGDAVKYDAFSKLLNVARQSELTPDYFPFLLESVKMLGEYKYQFFFESCDTAKRMGLMKNYFIEIKQLFFTLMEYINNLEDKKKFKAFTYLNNGIEGSRLTDELYSLLETQFLDLIDIYDNLSEIDKIDAFYDLERLPMNTKLIQNHFLALLEVVDKLHTDDKYYPFYCLMNSIENTKLFNYYFSHIEKLYLNLLYNIDDLPYEKKIKAIYRMIEVFKSNGIWSKHFSLVKTKVLAIVEHFDYTQKFDYNSLTSVIRDTDLENDIAVKKWKEKYESNK